MTSFEGYVAAMTELYALTRPFRIKASSPLTSCANHGLNPKFVELMVLDRLAGEIGRIYILIEIRARRWFEFSLMNELTQDVDIWEEKINGFRRRESCESWKSRPWVKSATLYSRKIT